MNPNTIRVGDTVQVRPAFGGEPAQPALVIGLEVTPRPRQKEGGERVQSVPHATIREIRCVLEIQYPFSDWEQWCYAEQIEL